MDEKNPKEMVNIELLEIYSHYNKMPFRNIQEQEYLSSLREEILDRMNGEKLITPEAADDQYVTDKELASIEVLFKAREHLTETLSGEELILRTDEVFEQRVAELRELQKQFSSVKASLAMSDLIVTKEMEEIILAEETGQITFEEFIKKAMEYVNKL